MEVGELWSRSDLQGRNHSANSLSLSKWMIEDKTYAVLSSKAVSTSSQVIPIALSWSGRKLVTLIKYITQARSSFSLNINVVSSWSGWESTHFEHSKKTHSKVSVCEKTQSASTLWATWCQLLWRKSTSATDKVAGRCVMILSHVIMDRRKTNFCDIKCMKFSSMTEEMWSQSLWPRKIEINFCHSVAAWN